MSVRFSLTQRYVTHLGMVVVTLLLGSYLITSSVVRSGLTSLFEHRLEHCRVVLNQYARVHSLTRTAELLAVLASPRFLAAVETKDPATLKDEAPHYAAMMNADLLVIADPKGTILYSSEHLDSSALSQVKEYFMGAADDWTARFVRLSDDGYLELYVADIYSADGVDLGRLVAGVRVSSFLATDLKNLTGFDVVVTHGTEVVTSTRSETVERMVDLDYFSPGHLTTNNVLELKLTGRQIVYLPATDALFDATITFVGSPDDLIAPLQGKINLFLLLLATVGGLTALVVVYLFTRERIGRQVDLLVGAAENIARGEMDFSIVPQSHDELGYLAGEMEKMRSRLVGSRSELDRAHEDRVNSERMAAIGRLATGIIHDFRNPMTIIRGNVDLIKEMKKAGKDSTKYFLRIQHQIDRMDDLAQDVLDYSKERVHLELQTLNLYDYMQIVREGLAPQFEEAGVTLEIDGPASLEIRLDSVRFRRVLDNILNNAREALRPGGRTCVTWNVQDGRVLICIEDNGPGIPEDIRGTIFEPFVTSGKKHGTGLGLAIAQKIVNDHGGEVSIESDSSWGTRFTISLPAMQVESRPKELASA